MRRSLLNKLTILFVLLFGYGCKARRMPVQNPSPQVVLQEKLPFSKIDTIELIRQNRANFDTFSAKAKADISINDKQNNATLNIRIKKDNAIWVSVTAIAGVEVARVLITADSIKLMNRLEDTYTKKPFQFIKDFTSGEVNFKMLQSILAGNCPDEFLTAKSILGNRGDTMTVNGMLNGLAYAMILKNDFKLTHANLKDDIAKQQLILSYSAFKAVGGQQLPTVISVKSTTDNRISIDMEYDKIILNEPVEMPFSVPKRFDVIN